MWSEQWLRLALLVKTLLELDILYYGLDIVQSLIYVLLWFLSLKYPCWVSVIGLFAFSFSCILSLIADLSSSPHSCYRHSEITSKKLATVGIASSNH